MMNFIRFFLMAGLVGAVYAQPLDSVVAVVNDQVITETELNRQVDALRTELDAKRSPIPEDNVLRKQVLQHLIDVDIDLQLAKKNDITLEKGEVDETIHRIADTNHMTIDELRDALAKRNMSWSTYKHNIYKEMLVGRVQQKAVAKDMMISKEQVEAYMKEHQEEVDKWIKQYKIGYFKPFESLARLTEEVGELAREINHIYGPKKKKKTEDMKELGDEMADVIFTIICLANSHNIDLDKNLKNVMDKCYGRDKDRWEKK